MKSNGNLNWGEVSFLLLPVLINCSLSCAYATPRSQEIESVIRESSDVPKAKKFTVGVKGTEAQIATYIETGSKDSDKDCKIDAVLLARIVINKFSDINRVCVNFYGSKGSKVYKQATVTKPEIVAFGSGALEGADFLSAIRLEEKVDQAVAAAEKKKYDEKEEKKNSFSEASKDAFKKAVARGQHPETSWVTYHAAGQAGYPGVAFDYPEVWRISRELERDILVSIKGAQSTINEPKIEMKLYQNPKKLDLMAEATKHAHGHQDNKNFKILQPSGIVKIGVGGAITAVAEHYSYTREDKDTSFEHHYYFGWPGYVYMIYSAATKLDQAHTDAVFKKTLSTIRMEAAKK